MVKLLSLLGLAVLPAIAYVRGGCPYMKNDMSLESLPTGNYMKKDLSVKTLSLLLSIKLSNLYCSVVFFRKDFLLIFNFS